jgi:hypothetical protein
MVLYVELNSHRLMGTSENEFMFIAGIVQGHRAAFWLLNVTEM